MIKKLTQVGNSKALLLDKTTLEHLGVVDDDLVQLTLSGHSLVVSAVHPQITPEEFDAAANRVFKKYSKALKDLA
jgi:antitoxin component of MazEF toxin-antitoxin module